MHLMAGYVALGLIFEAMVLPTSGSPNLRLAITNFEREFRYRNVGFQKQVDGTLDAIALHKFGERMTIQNTGGLTATLMFASGLAGHSEQTRFILALLPIAADCPLQRP